MQKLLALFLTMTLAIAAPAQALDLSPYRWQNRVIVIEAPSADHPMARAQRDAIDTAHHDFTDRDLVLVENYSPNIETFKVMLYGKDGTRKDSSTVPINPWRFYALIDTMPMRLAEMEL